MSSITNLISVGVNGTGTANSVMKWLDADTATDSIITDNGSTISIGGSLAVDTNTLYVDAVNTRVGIGTSSPADSFQVGSEFMIAANQLSWNRVPNSGNYIDPTKGSAIILSSTSTSGATLQFYTSSAPSSFAERMRIDSSGNVGIGTSSPGAKLDIHTTGATAKPDALRISNALAPAFYWDIWRDNTTGFLNFGGATGGALSTFLTIKNETGNVGIGTTNPLVRLHIVGGLVRNLDTYYNTTATAANMVVSSGGTFERSTSSLKYKKEVRDYDKGLDFIDTLRPVYYKGKSESDGDKQFAGLIAEEVHASGLEEFVQYAEDGSPDALAYTHMVALLVNGIKELRAEIETLKSQING